MIILDCVQGSEEWHKIKLGIPSASNFDKIITTDGKPSKQAEKYMRQLAVERITGLSEDSFKSGYMQRGNDIEVEAIDFYELIKGESVVRVGCCYQNEDKRFSCSPDALVGNDGGLELKCPSGAVHVGYLLDNKVPTEYFTQVQGNLFVTGREWWDFQSYYPGLKPLIVRALPDIEFQTKLKSALDQFCNDLEKLVKELSK